MKSLAVLILLAVVGFVAWQALGGQDATVPDAPTPDLPLPDNPGEAADSFWDTVDGLPQWVWRQLMPIVLLGGVLVYMSRKHKAALFLMMGIAVGVLIVVVANS